MFVYEFLAEGWCCPFWGKTARFLRWLLQHWVWNRDSKRYMIGGYSHSGPPTIKRPNQYHSHLVRHKKDHVVKAGIGKLQQ